jgi:hypothetical protein
VNSQPQEFDQEISVYSLKPIILSRLQHFSKTLSPFEKTEFLRKWMNNLRRRVDLPSEPIAIEDIPGIVTKLELELFGEKIGSFETDFNFVISDSPRQTSAEGVPTVFQNEQHVYLNGLKVSTAGRFSSRFRPKRSVWLSCESPSLGELSRSAAERVLWVKSCEGDKINEQIYFRSGLIAFAALNPRAEFISFHIPSVQLSLKWGANRNQSFDFGSPSPSRLDALLGLIDQRPGQIKGAIPAVDSFRSQHPGQKLFLVN